MTTRFHLYVEGDERPGGLISGSRTDLGAFEFIEDAYHAALDEMGLDKPDVEIESHSDDCLWFFREGSDGSYDIYCRVQADV